MGFNEEINKGNQNLEKSNQLASQLTEEARNLTSELKDQLGIRSRLSDGERELLSISQKITQSAQKNKAEIARQGDIQKQINTERQQFLDAEREKQVIINGLIKDGNNTALIAAQEIADINKSIEESQRKELSLRNLIDAASGKEKQNLLDSLNAQQAITESKFQELTTSLEKADSDTERLALAEQLVSKARENIEASTEQQKIQDKITHSMGLAGNILSGLNSIAPGFAKAFKADKIAADMKEFAEKSTDAENSVSRLQVLGVGLQSAFSNFKKTLTDPVAIFTTLYNSATAVSQEVTNLQRATGMSYGNATALNAELRMTAQTSGQIQISAKKLHEAFSQITTELGVSADILGGEALISMSNLTKKIGLGAKEATQLTLMSRLQGKNTEETLSNTVGVVNNLNKQNKTAINFKGVLSDVANSSKTLQVSLGANPQKLTEAAYEAKKLGLSLNELEGIADNLLNFESSIQAELEAELLTGKQINLEKAREYALNNDMKGLSEEIANNQEIASAFASGNRIEQQAIAKAMGMSKDQLANMYYQSELNKMSAEEFKERYGEAAYEQAKASSASEKFGYTLDRAKEIIGNIGMALAPVLDLFAKILSNSWVLYGLMTALALSYIPKMAKGFASFGKSVADGAKSVRDIGKGVIDLAKGKGSKTLKDAVIGKSDIDPVKKSGDQMKPGGGKGIKENLSGLGAGLKKMAGGQVTQGILNLALAGPALLLALPSIPFLLFMGLTPLNKLQSNFTSLGNGLKKMGGGPVFAGIGALALAGPALAIANLAIPFLTFMALPLGPLMEAGFKALSNGVGSLGNNFSNVAKGSLVLALLGASMIPAAYAFTLMEGVDPMNIILLSGSLTVLGLAAALLGNLGANIIIGAFALGVLGLALVPAAYAFSLLAGVDIAAMTAFSIALPLLALAAAGLGFISPFIYMGAGALAALGFALIPAAYAFSLIQGLDIASITSFAKGVGILATTAALIGFASPFIIAGSVALGALGLSMIPLATSLQMIANSNIEGLVVSLQGLAGVAPQLFGVAQGLGAISAGLGAMAFTGMLALPIIGALTALGAVSGALSSIFGGEGGGETKDEGSMKAVEQKLDQLIAIVSAGGDVYIDGAKVGKTLQLASSRLG